MIEIRFQTRAVIFLSSSAVHMATKNTATSSPEAEYCPAHCVEVKNTWPYTSTPSFSISSYLTENSSCYM